MNDNFALTVCEDIMQTVNSRMLDLEARITGTPKPNSNSQSIPQSPDSKLAIEAGQVTLDHYFSYNQSSNKSQRQERCSNSNSPPLEGEKAYGKRKRSNEELEPICKKIIGQSPFSGFYEVQDYQTPIDHDNSNSYRSDGQITELFQDFIQTADGNNFLKSSIINSMMQKLQQLRKAVLDKDQKMQEKDKIIQEVSIQKKTLQHELSSREDELQKVQEMKQKYDSNQQLGIAALVQTLKELEEKKRQELKAKLFNDSFRLGKATLVRQGARFTECWEDGKEIVENKEQLRRLQQQKQQLERLRKQNRKTDEDEFNIIPLKLILLSREEQLLKEKLERLEIEKAVHIQEWRRITEEDSAKYAKATPDHEAWPVLHNRYLLLSLLGKGGYSEVYKAYELYEHQYIAIKFHQLSSNWSESIKANYIKHALRENHIHRELNHPKIVKHYDTLEIDGNCFCTILEYCPDEDLHMYLKRHKQLPEKEAKMIMQQIFAGLKYLNDQGEKIIHYDLKPHNILLNNGDIKITDFGLSKIMDPSKTNMELTSQGVGTYWYQAPECFDVSPTPPKISSKVDVWSAGIIFYEMLYGQKPFGQGMPQEKVLKDQVIINARAVNFPNKPNVSSECKEFISKCLEYRQQDRYDVYEAYNSPYLRGRK